MRHLRAPLHVKSHTFQTMSAVTTESQEIQEDFSLVLGGPLFQMFRRAHLSGTALELLRRRVIVITALSWVPLLVLSVWEGRAWGTSVNLPFIHDVDAHVRFLISLPLMIAAEWSVHRRMRNVVRQFLERGLVPDNARRQFNEAVASAKRLRNSLVAELLLVAFVYSVGLFVIWRRNVAMDVSSWYSDGQFHPSLAGWWFGLVSLPFFQFLLFRWYYRLLVWARFLWQVSRIELNLFPTHPDRSGGLGFLSNVSYAFMLFLLAQGALLAGMMADRIFYAGAQLTQFKTDIAGFVVFVVFIILAPLLVFSPQLERAKRAGGRAYGALAQQYVREFDTKWIRGGAHADEPLLGSSDIQSLADLGNSYEVIKEMRWVPFSLRTVLELGVITLVPVLPLTLTMIPLDQLLDRVLKTLF
jgi:hypothetical protein